MPRVNPKILEWARKTAGLEPAVAVRKVGLRAARGESAESRLAALERGDEIPSRALLVRMAKQYRRPLVTFYLQEPPRLSDRGQDFRTTRAGGRRQIEPELDALLRSVLARQSLVKAALEAEEDVEPLKFVGESTIAQGAIRVAAELTKTLEFERGAYRATKTFADAFALLRGCAESAGVFVLLIGDLGSHHTAMSGDMFRGYALSDPIAPFIVINDRDARAAWPFTLLHEFCHLSLGYSGVSDVYGSGRIEKFCNDVASQVLVGDEELRSLAVAVRRPSADKARLISTFSSRTKVSRTLVAYRLHKLNSLSSREFSTLRDGFYEAWQEKRARVRVNQREQDGGPSYYVVRRHRIGDALLGTVSYLLRSGALTTSRAGRVLGVQPKNVAELLAGAIGN